MDRLEITEDTMACFLIGFVLVFFFRLPVKVWIGLSFVEGFIELVFTISTAVLTAPN